jgi:hypothetical protein
MVLGDSMEPEFVDGDIIIIEPEGLATDGSYVMAWLNDEWIFRQLADVRAGRPPMEPTGRDVVGWIVALADGYRAAAAPGRAPVGPLKEQVSWLGRAVRDDGVWRAQALLMPTVDALCAYTEQELLTRPAEAFDLAWENRFGLMQGGDCEQS